MRDIDYERRRTDIADVAVQVISSEGLEAATIRRIAAEAGYSTTVITHYFDNKDELLHAAYLHISNALARRLEAIDTHNPDGALDTLMTMMALDEEMRRRWQVYIAFWQRAERDPVFRHEHKHGLSLAQTQLETVLRQRRGNATGIPEMARRLIALVHGISMQLLFDPLSWSRPEIEKTFARELGSSSARTSAVEHG